MNPQEDISHFSRFVLIAGLSGAGKSTTSRTFSDHGYFTIDNLPIPLLPNFLALSRHAPERYLKTSLLLDIVSQEQQKHFANFLATVPEKTTSLFVLFLDASSDSIRKRYSETRRPHPAFDPAVDRTLEDAIERERTMLFPIRELAHSVIDSSSLSPHDLRRKILIEIIGKMESLPSRTLRVNFQSFGFKYGSPPDCDLLIDVRFLPNPYFQEDLRCKTGQDIDVREFVLRTDQAQEFIRRYADLLRFLLPQYIHEGKAYLNIGIGCTGGKHRSVALAHELEKQISDFPCLISVNHRDITRS